ncbi:hypothetical protein TorRG33x02_127260 [Trema orientale]|uniref:Uncharacterized protein n=1 Tax=Trema orientale TaxID=63057 RepID=A0A2P5F0X4_TREOI|nr:hypothetical protein TorRG33x02_127260 [Trema orientale]
MLFYDFVANRSQILQVLLQPPLVPAHRVDPPPLGEKIPYAKPTQQLLRLRQNPHQMTLLPLPGLLSSSFLLSQKPPPECDSAQDIIRQGEQHLAHVHLRGRPSRDVAHHPGRLLRSDDPERVDSLRAEQLGDAYLSGLAPVGAVAGEGDVGAPKGEVLRRHELGAAGEDVVMGLEDEPGEPGGGDDEGRDLAEPEEEDGTESVGEPGKGVVGHGGEEVEVAEYGEASGRWWGPSGLPRRLSTAPAGQAYDVEKVDGDKYESEDER